MSTADSIPPPPPPPSPSSSAALAYPPDEEGGVLGRRYRGLTFGIISVVSLIAFEASAVSTAMPIAARALDGIGLYAFAFSAYFTASLFSMALSGEWSDRSGPLGPLFTGIAAFGAGLVLAGCSQDMWMFVGSRFVQGLGGGMVLVSLYVVVGRAYPERLRAKILAAFSAAWVVPVLVGPVVAGSVAERLSWRWVFLAIPVLVLLPLLIMLPALRKLPRTDRGGSVDRRRVLLALAVAGGAGLLQYAGQDRTWLALVPAAAGLALLAPSIVRLVPKGTFRAARGLPSVVLLRGVAAGAFLGAESFIPLMLVTERDLSATAAGLSLTGGGLAWALGSFTQSRSGLERHRNRLMGLGMVLVSASVALVPLVLIDGVPVWLVAVAWIVGGYGIGLTISSSGILVLSLSRPGEEGINSAALQLSDALGNIVLVGAGGVLFGAFGGGTVAADGDAADTAAPPAAFVSVYVTLAAVALAGAWITTRLRPAAETTAVREDGAPASGGPAGGAEPKTGTAPAR
ncbi:MFS transporter [Streptomyces mobaraensis NBRC 13819 = DSM 40847]|uniref:MFS transporter n=1 Tax=Streptomyces mobaraensis TaxID=35621 RepID=UPI00034BA67C|nr:MFS transporter [Streptomyces mobaraensis]QTT74023.1 MFS transporter [Streptomyces mobaraensis NBRC 13819 = DSM 40847]